MKEILIELTRAIENICNNQVYYDYEEKEINTNFGIERHLFIVEKSKYSNQITQIVFRKSNIQSKESAAYIKIDYFEVLRKEMLLEVFRYGVFSAIDSLKRFKEQNDKTTNSK